MSRAAWVLALCDRFGCLPSQLDREPADLMELIEIERVAGLTPARWHR